MTSGWRSPDRQRLWLFRAHRPDHLIDGCISPFAALAVVAEATSTLRVGTLVLNNDLRHPALVAREALALDSLSEGRVELGLGAGSAMSSPNMSRSACASMTGRRE
jgi:alkanesulfonate monooxygenase SsuD/methylene tetrahydromethanopterin reductase-like flavin-dependent oxidoreductase (luciferase family)